MAISALSFSNSPAFVASASVTRENRFGGIVDGNDCESVTGVDLFWSCESAETAGVEPVVVGVEVVTGAFVDVAGGTCCVLAAAGGADAAPLVLGGCCSCVGGAGLGVAVLAGIAGVALAGEAPAGTPGLAETRA